LLWASAAAWAGEAASVAAKDSGRGFVADKRATEFRHKDLAFPIVSYSSKEVWTARADYVRKQVLVANGLWPLPEKTPLNAKRFGRIDRDGYSIEKACFESYPGFFCTGNLYLPRDRKPPYPAVLCPHGHWKEGRLADEKDGSVVARCITFARQGYVVFSPDMVGYNDSKQMAHRNNHYASPLWGLSLMGLQTWNNIRGIDFLLSIEGVDPKRIGCTGASGGGTQTFILTAVEDRVKCAVPVCMVSDYFQGGCECENAPLLRVSATNIEIAASAAPRPYMITGATGDWTKNIMTAQGPAIREIYKLFDAADKFNFVIVDAGHNYNKETREHVYRWMGKWLLNETDAEKLREQPYTVEKKEDVLVFTPEHPLPAGSLDEQGVRDSRIAATKQQIEAHKPKAKRDLREFREVYGTALWHTFVGRERGIPQIEADRIDPIEGKGWAGEKLILTQPQIGSRIPALLLNPKGKKTGKAAVVVHPDGKAGLAKGGTAEPGPLVAALLDAGYTVLAPDCFLTGESQSPTSGTKRALPKEFPYTYNPTTLAWRVQDILTMVHYLREKTGGGNVDLAGVGAAGPWCLLAAAVGEQARTVVDANGFADADEASWQGDMFQPNILRCGGLRGAGALVAPAPLLIHNTGGKLDTAWIADVYRAAGAAKALRPEANRLSDKDIVEWLTTK
jgi:dienelactone hydrolase